MLQQCLKEVDSSDAMVGLYGERYGWHLSDERDTGENDQLQRSFEMAKKSFPWVERFKDRSVTEVEMRMILDKLYKGPEKSAWFYMRDEYYIEEVPKAERALYQSEGPKSKAKLDQLKLEIAQSSYPNRNYHRPDQIEELVLADLRDLLDAKFPAGEALSAVKREEFRHMAYGRGLTRTYVPNEGNFMLLDKYVLGEETKPLLVGGLRGVGKSALLANWGRRYAEHHPEDILLVHHVGCSPTSASYSHLLWRLMTQTQDSLGFAESLPAADDTEHIARFFLKWVEKALDILKKAKKKVVWVLDGLDKIDDRNNAGDLVWWPQTLPPQIRVVVSSGPSRVYDVLAKRGCSKTEVNALTEAERKSLIRLHLNRISKKLEERQEFTIAGAQQTANPRFLLTLLDDIAVFGAHEDLEKKIASDLHAQNTAELYEIVMERLERDCDKEGKGFVAAFLANVWAARRGLLIEEELCTSFLLICSFCVLIGSFSGDHGRPRLPTARVEQLLLAGAGDLAHGRRLARQLLQCGCAHRRGDALPQIGQAKSGSTQTSRRVLLGLGGLGGDAPRRGAALSARPVAAVQGAREDSLRSPDVLQALH